MQGVFNPNILVYHLPNSAEGVHFSAFHYACKGFSIQISIFPANSAEDLHFSAFHYVSNYFTILQLYLIYYIHTFVFMFYLFILHPIICIAVKIYKIILR